jgi:hypothetical protein
MSARMSGDRRRQPRRALSRGGRQRLPVPLLGSAPLPLPACLRPLLFSTSRCSVISVSLLIFSVFAFHHPLVFLFLSIFFSSQRSFLLAFRFTLASFVGFCRADGGGRRVRRPCAETTEASFRFPSSLWDQSKCFFQHTNSRDIYECHSTTASTTPAGSLTTSLFLSFDPFLHATIRTLLLSVALLEGPCSLTGESTLQ